jgi:hypothetical protein
MVFNVFTLKRQIARLLNERDAAARQPAVVNKPSSAAASSAAGKNAEGVPVQRSKMTQPSAPPAEIVHNANAAKLD